MHMRWPERLLERWQRYSLATQFALAASIAVGSCMTILGIWVTSKIEEGVVENSAVTTAFYMESLLAPLLQPLVTEPILPATSKSALERIFSDTPLGRQIINFRIWTVPTRRPSLTRTILYSTAPGQIGKSFDASIAYTRAASGFVVKTLAPASRGEDYSELKFTPTLLEIYTPIYESGTKRVIAVAEFYQKTDALRATLRNTRALTFLVVGGSTLGMLAVLFGIVWRGSSTIASQRVFLEQRVGELSTALSHIEVLNERLVQARRRTGETNERLLRRVGADLHDGPAQLIGLALLRIDALHPETDEYDACTAVENFNIIQSALAEALEELRNLSAGIAPPRLNNVSLKVALELAARNHEKRTGTEVELDLNLDACPPIPIAMRTCLYRFAQEGLSNAFKHAAGNGQMVLANFEKDAILVEIRDSGPGIDPYKVHNSDGLGLAGLRDRVESLGGQFVFSSPPNAGTRLIARFNLVESETHNV